MKNAWPIAFVCIAACMLLSVSAFGEGGPKPQPLPKAKTIAELAARYDSSKCIECHEDTHDEWSESLHSKSILGSPRTAPTIITAIDKGLDALPLFRGQKGFRHHRGEPDDVYEMPSAAA